MKTLINKTGTWLVAGAAALTLNLAASCTEAEENPGAIWLLGLADGQTEVVMDTASPDDPTDLFDDPLPAEDPLENVEFTYESEITSGDETFVFESNKTITFTFDIKTDESPAGGTLFRIVKVPTGGSVIYQAVASDDGNVSGSFTVDTAAGKIYIEIEYNGKIYTKEVTVIAVYRLTGVIRIQVKTEEYTFPDTDGDGVRDLMDYYPEDPSRSAMIRIPDDGTYYTVAYEDLYPKPGDMDFNDMVVKVRYEQDLNASGDAVRMRVFYQHIAKGAGYNHILYQKIGGLPEATLNFERYGYPVDGVLPVEFSEARTITAADALHIFSSKESIAQSNTNVGGVYAGGKQAKAEYIFSNPVPAADLGKAPYDLYLYVINTKKEIHFAGLGYTVNGSEKYLDTNGFPWALMLPGKWSWPYERGDIHAAYSSFSQWYMSYGAEAQDWYKNPLAENVFPY